MYKLKEYGVVAGPDDVDEKVTAWFTELLDWVSKQGLPTEGWKYYHSAFENAIMLEIGDISIHMDCKEVWGGDSISFMYKNQELFPPDFDDFKKRAEELTPGQGYLDKMIHCPFPESEELAKDIIKYILSLNCTNK